MHVQTSNIETRGVKPGRLKPRTLKLAGRVTSAILVLLNVTQTTLPVEGADTSSATPNPPIARKIPKITEINGTKLVDNYFWLRDKKNPEVKAYLDAENAYADQLMKPTEPLQSMLYNEMLGRIKETDV